MVKKTTKTISSMLSLNKIKKNIMFMLKPNNIKKVLLLVGVLIVLFLLHKQFFNKEGMTTLNKENIDQTVSQQKTAVLFYADWCGHCKKLMPTWDKIGEELDENSPVVLAKFDCSKSAEDKNQQQVMKKYNVKGFPTILLFENGKVKEFEQERNEENIKSFLGF
jgi:protein disulfide-isomerase-like protein